MKYLTLINSILILFLFILLGWNMNSDLKTLEILENSVNESWQYDFVDFHIPAFTQEALETYPAEQWESGDCRGLDKETSNIDLCQKSLGEEKKPVETVLCDYLVKKCYDMATLPKPPWGYFAIATTSDIYKCNNPSPWAEVSLAEEIRKTCNTLSFRVENKPDEFNEKHCLDNGMTVFTSRSGEKKCISLPQSPKPKYPLESEHFTMSYILEGENPDNVFFEYRLMRNDSEGRSYGNLYLRELEVKELYQLLKQQQDE